jgi:signal transduction histidine kinase
MKEPHMNVSLDHRPSGIRAVGELPWGAHFCHFYRDREDLVDSLVPYFKAGLDGNERCLWVTSEPFRAEDARTALRTAVPDVEERIRRGQLEILDHDEWYTRTGKADAAATLSGWIEREQRALALGYQGLRLTGNTYWLERKDWKGFVEYESRVTETFANHRIIGLCSYCLDRCRPEDVLDVVRNHQFALARREGEWHLLESASLQLAKRELHQLNQELEQRVRERTAELESALRVREAFLSVASHELKTPITSLQLYVDGLLRAQRRAPLQAEEFSNRLSRAHHQCQRLERLINNLLDISRGDLSENSFNREPVDLGALAADTVERLGPDLARSGNTVQLRAAEPVVGAWDRMRLEQVVSNLLTNAIKHASGTDVRVEVGREGQDAVLAICDAGPGIPAADHARIFERFTRGSSTVSPSGFGLGLWIIREIAEAHGGSVQVSSAPGAGATFTLRLPLLAN